MDDRLYLLIAAGAIFYLSLYFGQKQSAKSPDAPIKAAASRDAAKTFKFANYLGGLALVWGGLALTVYGISITSGGRTMTTADTSLFHSAAVLYVILFFVIVGMFAAAWVVYFIEYLVSYFKYKKHGLPPSVNGEQPAPASGGNPDKPKINIDFKMDTADIAKMRKDQTEAVNAIIDRLQGKQ